MRHCLISCMTLHSICKSYRGTVAYCMGFWLLSSLPSLICIRVRGMVLFGGKVLYLWTRVCTVSRGWQWASVTCRTVRWGTQSFCFLKHSSRKKYLPGCLMTYCLTPWCVVLCPERRAEGLPSCTSVVRYCAAMVVLFHGIRARYFVHHRHKSVGRARSMTLLKMASPSAWWEADFGIISH